MTVEQKHRVRSFCLGITYAPKIQGVLDGRICTTIRYRRLDMKRTPRIDDELLLYGKEKPGRYSAWTWRYVVRIARLQAYLIVLYDPFEGMPPSYPKAPKMPFWGHWMRWNGSIWEPMSDVEVEAVAQADGIPHDKRPARTTLTEMMIANYYKRAVTTYFTRSIPLMLYGWDPDDIKNQTTNPLTRRRRLER